LGQRVAKIADDREWDGGNKAIQTAKHAKYSKKERNTNTDFAATQEIFAEIALFLWITLKDRRAGNPAQPLATSTSNSYAIPVSPRFIVIA